MANLCVTSLSSRLAYWMLIYVDRVVSIPRVMNAEGKDIKCTSMFCWVSHNIKDCGIP